jgi:hypothetical protein
MPFYIKPDHAIFAAIGTVLLGFISAQLSILVGCALVAYMMWMCDARYLPALMIAVWRPTDFLLKGYGSFDFALAEVASSYIMVGGMPVTINLVMIVMVPARVLFEFFNNPNYACSKVHPGWLFIWGIALIPALIMALLGKLEGNNGWADPVRSVFVVGSYFYGLFMARTWPTSGDFIYRRLVPIILAIFVIKYTVGFHHRILWIWGGMLPALSLYLFQFKRPLSLLCSGGVMLFAVIFSFNILSSSTMTFTLVGLFLVSLVMGVIAFIPMGGLRKFFGWFFGWPAVATMFVFVSFVVWKYEDLARPGEKSYTLVDKLRSKVFDDRAGVWTSSIRSIGDGNMFIHPAGRPWILRHEKKGEIEVLFGSHNSIIDQLRKNRLIAGPLILLIVFFAVVRSSQVLRHSPIPEAKVLAITCIATGTVGIVTGHYPLSQNAGFWFLSFGGIAYGIFTNARLTQSMIRHGHRPHHPRRGHRMRH